MKYRVCITETITTVYEVEAAGESLAIERAEAMNEERDESCVESSSCERDTAIVN